MCTCTALSAGAHKSDNYMCYNISYTRPICLNIQLLHYVTSFVCRNCLSYTTKELSPPLCKTHTTKILVNSWRFTSSITEEILIPRFNIMVHYYTWRTSRRLKSKGISRVAIGNRSGFHQDFETTCLLRMLIAGTLAKRKQYPSDSKDYHWRDGKNPMFICSS